MTPTEMIAAYADDVARRLPAKQRNDVGFELRTLLEEQLRERAGDAGRLPDEAMALQMLREFGAPDEVAARYGGPGLVIVEPVYAGRFVKLAFGGLALQWLLTLPTVFVAEDWLLALSRWWMSYGLGAFWWPGFLVISAIIAAWARRRWPVVNTWRPKIVDRDLVNRSLTAMGAGLLLTVVALMVVLPAIIASAMPRAALPYFSFDQEFWTQRAPFILPLWAAHFVVLGFLIVRGRWTRNLRLAEVVINLLVCAVMIWWIAAGPIFATPTTDSTTKSIMGLVVAMIALDLGLKLRRWLGRVRPPDEIAGRIA